jgi:hypothetical protein
MEILAITLIAWLVYELLCDDDDDDLGTPLYINT